MKREGVGETRQSGCLGSRTEAERPALYTLCIAPAASGTQDLTLGRAVFSTRNYEERSQNTCQSPDARN